MHIPIGKIMTPADWLETVVVVRPASDDVRARRCPDDDDDDGDREVNKLRASARLRASPNERTSKGAAATKIQWIDRIL